LAKEGTMMKGFVITLISVSLIVILVVMAISLRNEELRSQRVIIEPLPLIYSSFYFDSVAQGLNKIAGPELELQENNTSTIIRISDRIETDNHAQEIVNFADFISGDFAQRTQSNISMNLSNITNGTNKLFIHEDYIYINDHNMNQSNFTKEGGTGARTINIQYNIGAVRSNVTSPIFSNNGTMNMSFVITDLNGTINETGLAYANQVTFMTIDYIGGCQITIQIGRINSNDGSYSISTTNCEIDYSAEVELQPLNFEKKYGYQYDATMNYSQGKIEKSDRIGK
jgi:hypothetical protein